jgi:hypothetical protein
VRLKQLMVYLALCVHYVLLDGPQDLNKRDEPTSWS